jgi:hypothetical protein
MLLLLLLLGIHRRCCCKVPGMHQQCLAIPRQHLTAHLVRIAWLLAALHRLHAARQTLENAIAMVESHPTWRARVVYGDTDSMFVLLQVCPG